MVSRIRHHVDPFRVRIQLKEEDWIDAYKESGAKEIGVDLGCGKGEFVSCMANLYPKMFFIGMDIRDKLREKYYINYEEKTNLKLFNGNANLSLVSMFSNYKIDKVFINFPDPYSKKNKQKKRRMINEALTSDLYKVMKSKGLIYFQSDDFEVFKYSNGFLSKQFISKTDISNPQDVENITGCRSSWEKACMKKEIPIYRAVYEKA